MKNQTPAYKNFDNARDTLTEMSANLGSIAEGFNITRRRQDPEAVRKYMESSLPAMSDEEGRGRSGQGKRKASASSSSTLCARRSPAQLHPGSGEKEWKDHSIRTVWRTENRSGASEAAKTKPRFAGEQMITTAILALQQPKKLKVAIVRAGARRWPTRRSRCSGRMAAVRRRGRAAARIQL